MDIRQIELDRFYPAQNIRTLHVIEDFLSPEECKEYQDLFDSLSAIADRTDDKFRQNSRVIKDGLFIQANQLYARLSGAIDLSIDDNLKPARINDRFNIYKYGVGDAFAYHVDQPYVIRENQEISFYTLLMYLNDGFEGGETLVGGSEKITPKEGSALLFPHYILHSAEPVFSGVRYTMKTDVMYSRA